MDKLLDIHYCILIKRYGCDKALEMMKKILPPSYQHEIEQDESNIMGHEKLLLGFCRNKWPIEMQLKYLLSKYQETKNHIYLDIRSYQDSSSRTGVNESIEDEYLQFIGEE